MELHTRESTEMEELYSSWSLFIVCVLLILSLLTSYYLQVNRIRAVHETVVSIFAGMVVGLIVRLAPGHLIREMLVSGFPRRAATTWLTNDYRRHSATLFSSTYSYPRLSSTQAMSSARQVRSGIQHPQKITHVAQ